MRALRGKPIEGISAAEQRRLAWHLPADFRRRPKREREEIPNWVRSVIIAGSTEYRAFQREAGKQRSLCAFPPREYASRRASNAPRPKRKGNLASKLTAFRTGTRPPCPRCNNAMLFSRFLKSADICSSCGQDWTHQQADDFPAYVSIFLTGHIMAPIIIALVQDTAS